MCARFCQDKQMHGQMHIVRSTVFIIQLWYNYYIILFRMYICTYFQMSLRVREDF